MSRNTKILGSVLIVIVLGFVAFYLTREDRPAFDAKETDFAVENIDTLDMIFIADRNGNNHKMTKNQEGEWYIKSGDDEYKAAPFQINMLLNTLEDLTVRSPVPKTARNTVIKQMATTGIKVELYSNKKLLKTFYVGGNTSDDLGTYFLMEGSESPYAVHIRGFNGFLSGRFIIRKREWIDRTFFDSRKKDIQQLSVNYSGDSLESFTIRRENGALMVEGVDALDTLALNRYIVFYKEANLESFVEVARKEIIKDSVQAQTPFCTITLEDKNPKKSHQIDLYKSSSPDRMWGIIETGDLVTVQYFVFDKLFVERSNFEKAVPVL